MRKSLFFDPSGVGKSTASARSLSQVPCFGVLDGNCIFLQTLLHTFSIIWFLAVVPAPKLVCQNKFLLKEKYLQQFWICGRNNECMSGDKGQIKQKAVRAGHQFIPKRWTNEFVLFAMKSKNANKPNQFVCLLGESTASQSALGFIWPLDVTCFYAERW